MSVKLDVLRGAVLDAVEKTINEIARKYGDDAVLVEVERELKERFDDQSDRRSFAAGDKIVITIQSRFYG